MDNCVTNCYQCIVQKLIITKPNQTITAINGRHANLEDSSNNAVTLKIIDQVVAFIPSRLDQHFPFLSILKIWSSELSSLSQKDIRDVKFLTDLSLSGNHLETLSSNLFQFNRRLIIVDFTRNRLRHIGQNILKPLKSLVSVDFYQNYCINNGARHSFESLESQLRQNCQPTSEMLMEEVSALTEEVDLLNKKVKRRERRIKACEHDKSWNSHATLNSLFPTILTNEF